MGRTRNCSMSAGYAPARIRAAMTVTATPVAGRRHVPRKAATTKRAATRKEMTARIECAGSVALISEYMAPWIEPLSEVNSS